jgi:antitoxin ParD1/3/4
MTIEISAEHQAFVREVIQRGSFSTEADVVNEALRLLREFDLHRDELRRELQEGIDELDRGEEIDGEEVFRELRERLAVMTRQG